MTFRSSVVDVFIFSLLWTGVLLSISHRNYNQPPNITTEPRSAYCVNPSCDVGDTVTIYFKEEETIRIRCNASGRPSVSYKWTKDGTDFDIVPPRISIKSEVGTLIINNATKLDQGTFQCSATNEFGTALSKKAKVVFAISEAFKTVIQPEKFDITEGLSLSLKCDQPYVVPKPNVYWTYVGEFMVEDPQLSRVTLDNRVAMDYDGTLHFANIKRSDVKDDGKFICNMHNYIYRTYSEGEDKIVNVIPSESVNAVKLLWKSQANVVGLKGEQVKFMCIFAGKRTPEIQWKRKGAALNNRMKVTEAGHELVISDLEYGDKGEYECSATNDVNPEPVVEKFQLQVEARPYWVKEPVDVTIGVEEDAEFPCMVEGIPKPVVEWFINGIPISEVPNSRRTLQKDMLVFKNVSDKDSQVIQCKATNKHGSVFADVYLNVLALKPEITQNPWQMKVAEGNSVSMVCENNGKPDPVLKWKKGIQTLTGDRYEFTKFTLTIKDVVPKDNGTYTCVAKNRYGEDSKTGELTVRKKTSVKLTPRERELQYGQTAVFSCSHITDPAELPFLVKTWYKNGQPIENDDDDGNIKIADKGDTLTIMKISSKDSANYTCHADNKVDNASAVGQLKVKAPPDPPQDVTFKTCGNLKVTLLWRPGFDNYLPISNYIIYSKTFFDNDFSKMIETTGSTNEIELKLSPYANYTFKISARNQLGESSLSKSTNICETKADFPAHHPKNVRIPENLTGKLVIEWDAIKPIDQNGPDFKYVIYVRKDSDRKSYEVKDWQTTRKVIDVGNVYEPYVIEVKAVNSKGESNERPLIYRGHSGMGVPNVTPSNFEIDPDVPFTHESVGLMWDPVDTSDKAMQGKFNGYKIRYWNMENPEKIKELEVHSKNEGKTRRRRRQTEKVRATAHLPPFSNLQLDVVARNTYFDSNGSNVINVSTPEGLPGPVEGLESMYRSGHFVKLKWQKPTKENGIIQGYDVEYEEIKGLGLDKVTKSVDSKIEFNKDWNQYEVGVPGLELNTQYRIHVWAKTGAGRGDEMYIDVKTAPENVPTVPSIQEAVPGKNFINVSWQINKADVAGYYYYVEYRRYGDHDFTAGQMEKRNTWQVIYNLTAAQTYELRVVAKSGKYESRSEKKTITTIGATAVASAVYEATWFIIMMVVLALLILILIIVCLVKRNRGDKYHVQEKEKLRGLENDEKKTAQYNGFNDNGETQPLAGSPDDYDRGPLESDKDSLEEYADPDPSRFNEDGSFIGQYGAEKMTASEVAVPSSMHPNV